MISRLLVSVFVFVTACSGFGVAASSTTGTSVSVPTRSTTTSTTTTTLPPTTTTEPPTPLGLMTPTGVPVAIEAISGEGYVVVTPCGRSAVLTSGTPIYQTTVVIDPGHGGEIDTGPLGINGLSEKELNLTIATEVQGLLIERGIDTILTRTADYATTLATRTNFANVLMAEVLVSIHHNAPNQRPSEVPGVEVYVQSGSDDSQRLGGLLWEHVFDALSEFDVEWTAAIDAGVMTVVNSQGNDAYGMIRRPETPTALIEMGYLSNPAEAELFASAEYVETAATAVADAIEAYLETDAPGSGLGEGRTFNPQPGLGQDICVDPDLGDEG